MRHIVLSLIAAVVIIGSSIAHGLWTHRWTGAQQLSAAAAKVAQVPMMVGDWAGEDLEVSKEEMEMTGAYGYITRRYVNRATGQTVVAMLLCGQTGPLAAHTPTICLPGSGMELAGKERRFSPRRDETRNWGEFFQADFAGTSEGTPLRTRMFWAWSADGANWQAPARPRLTLAGNSYLFKLFVHRALERADLRESGPPSLDDDSCALFLRDLLPEVKKAARAGARTEKPADET